MITYAALVILLFTSDGPGYISKLFDTHFNCQVAEANILTKARDDQKVVGWVVVSDCPAVSENVKS